LKSFSALKIWRGIALKQTLAENIAIPCGEPKMHPRIPCAAQSSTCALIGGALHNAKLIAWSLLHMLALHILKFIIFPMIGVSQLELKGIECLKLSWVAGGTT
jgi:hypothetical protein